MKPVDLDARSSFYASHGKRLLDLLIAVPVSIVLAPITAVVALLVRREDGGPAIYKQERVGKGGDSFVLRKFRSMPVGTAVVESGNAGHLTVTRIGKVLRRTSMDEIPQLVSVLNGDMSVVGPRPPVPSQTDLVEMRVQSGAIWLKPGMTGLAQVNSFDGMSSEQKANLDAQYARSVRLVTDLSILLRTVGYLFRKPPQY